MDDQKVGDVDDDCELGALGNGFDVAANSDISTLGAKSAERDIPYVELASSKKCQIMQEMQENTRNARKCKKCKEILERLEMSIPK